MGIEPWLLNTSTLPSEKATALPETTHNQRKVIIVLIQSQRNRKKKKMRIREDHKNYLTYIIINHLKKK